MVSIGLDKSKKGQYIKIAHIHDAKVRAQAIRFGIAEGEIAMIGEILPAGPVILVKNNQEIAVGRSLAQEILVEIV